MDERAQKLLEAQEAARAARGPGVNPADLSDEEITLRGDQAKETTVTQLRQLRDLARLRAKAQAKKK